MAFDSDGLGVLAYCNGFTLWHYHGADSSFSTIKTNGFFNPAADLMRLGDLIVVQAKNDISGMRRVSLQNGAQVNTAAMA
mgnify:CR=1 FL=1|jgi:hypothetical protein